MDGDPSCSVVANLSVVTGAGVPEDWTIWRDLAGEDWPGVNHVIKAVDAALGEGRPAPAEAAP